MWYTSRVLEPGQVLKRRYRVIRTLGEGGLGLAVLVRDLVFDRDAVLKLLRPEASGLASVLSREFGLLSRLAHPRLVRVFDLGWLALGDERRAYYSTAHVAGEPLGKWAKGRSFEEIRPALIDAVSALAYLHRIGLRHGDVKPDNLVVTRDGSATLIDFSCARPLDGASSQGPTGTPGYMAPELRGGRPNHRADLFAFGATLARLADLGIVLPPDVIRLAERLRQDDPEMRPADSSEVLCLLGAEPYRRPPWILGGQIEGRADVLASFDGLLAKLRVTQSERHAFHLHGAPGVGKSRLLTELKWRAEEHFEVIEGNARQPRAVASLLERAAGDDTRVDSMGDALDAWDGLARSERPVVLLMDDVHVLDDSEARLLTALLRTLSVGGPVTLVTSGAAAFERFDAGLEQFELGPLSLSEVDRWLGKALPARQLRGLMAATGGFPADVHALVVAASARDLELSDLTKLVSGEGRDSGTSADLDALDASGLRVLALLVAAGGELGEERVQGLQPSAIFDLVESGLLRPTEGGLALTRRASAGAIEAALGEASMHEAHRRHAALLEVQRREVVAGSRIADDIEARLLFHRARGGMATDAARELLRSRDAAVRSPDLFVSVANFLEHGEPNPELRLLVAEIRELAGDARGALAVLTRALRSRPDPLVRTRIRRRAGGCYTQLGDSTRAIRLLRRAAADAVDAGVRVRALEQLSLALVKTGNHAEAKQVAGRGLALDPTPKMRGHLLCDAALSVSFLGDPDEARALADEAAQVLEAAHDVRGRFRALSARGTVDFQRGRASDAAESFRQAEALVTSHRLDDLVVPAALNHAAAAHRLGELGTALSAYIRGLRMATAVGMPSAEVRLLFNLARLYVDVGSFDHGATYAERAEARAREAGMHFMCAAAQSVKGEIASERGEWETALRWLAEAGDAFASEGALREQAEVALSRAEAVLGGGDPSLMEASVEEARILVNATKSDDLLARLGLIEGQHLLTGDPARSVTTLEAASARAEAAGDRILRARLHGLLAAAFERTGAPKLALRHADRAQEIAERVVATLPPEHRGGFLRRVQVPHRALPPALPAGPGPHAEAAEAPALAQQNERLMRLLDINRRLNSARTTKDVLREAMDAAVALSRAERGFLIVSAPNRRKSRRALSGGARKFRVAVARNIDREQIGRSHLKFSRGIAERVMETGDPVVTVDAAVDARFSASASVHAMQLKSIACVPISSPDGVVGAIYLDNRFQHGHFDEEVIPTLLALADQVAIALTQARLVEDLSRRTAALEAERERTRALMEGQRLQIEQLDEELKIARVSRHGHAYDDIVGSSRAMERVFQVMDRVSATDVTVLIRGETGTGKELIARGIHDHSERREGPFVAINCGALPDNLLEAELFGYRKGAFTGANRDHEGLFLAADSGTLFLDELGEMSPGMQVKLLRVLQEREVRPLGAEAVREVDVRVVCATNRDLKAEIEKGRFREDLYYRVAVVEVELPPLRERVEDIPAIAERILARIGKRYDRERPVLGPRALGALMAHAWPGNIRQLENVLTKALLLSDTDRLDHVDLPRSAVGAAEPPNRRGFVVGEAARMRAVLDLVGWNVVRASREMGIARATFYRKMDRYEIVRPGGD
ncbi:MAG: hypothetical protein DRJ42_16600 [Deltaproteobacteria bacterium]|nr:MAG: hypothetical protein DRJ42_16600 [Deltaproteobacteria bacterium]